MADVEAAKTLFFEALARLDAHDYAAAEERLRAALAIVPDRISALTNLSVALFHQNRISEATATAERAIALEPNDADALVVLASCLARDQRANDALVTLDRAIAVAPDNVAARISRATVLAEQKQFDRALPDYRKALALNPDEDDLPGALVHARMHAADWDGLNAEIAALLAKLREGKRVSHPFYLFGMPSTAVDQRAAATLYAQREFPVMEPPLWQRERYIHDRIRIAYVSGDFRDHALAYLTAGMFEHHDRRKFETIGISHGPDDGSAILQRLSSAFDRFIDVRGKSDRDIATLVRALETDIAVDLSGFTMGARPQVFAMRPAPIQVSFLGYPGTMGMPAIDYLIADEIVIPVDQRRHYAEEIVTLPHSYFPNDNRRRVSSSTPMRSDAGLPESGFVFCSFNNTYKITSEIFDVWMNLLRQIDGSVLWLIATNASAPVNLRQEAAARGVAPERLVFAQPLPIEDHVARQRLADLFLDTVHYNAHTTACDALWVGLPVVTYRGDTFTSRVAASLLHAAGLPELVTTSLAGYERLALQLARDPARLASIRARLVANRDTCALFDTAAFTRHIEAAYTGMAERSRRGGPPEGFTVPA